MKSFLIIGLGRFGTHLCKDLSKLDNEIMVVDENEAVMEDVLSFVTSAKIGDCTCLRKWVPDMSSAKQTVIFMPNFCCGTVLTKLSTLTGISQKKLQSVSLPTRSLTTLN